MTEVKARQSGGGGTIHVVRQPMLGCFAAVSQHRDIPMNASIQIDLRERGDLPAHTYAFYRLRTLREGQIAELIAPDEPSLTLDAVSLNLRHRIHWELVEAGPPLWRVRVAPREDVEASTLMDVLQRDHERVDRLFASALGHVNLGQLAAAATELEEFGRGLRRHIHVENELLAPAFSGPRRPFGDDPTSIMLREHEEILQQLTLIEASFDDGLPAAAEVAPFFAMLSGQLAKHEGREELNLFPLWSRALRAAGPEAEPALVRRVKAALAGEDDVAAFGSSANS